METNSAGHEGPFEEEVHQQRRAEIIVHLGQMVNNSGCSDVVFICNDGKRVQAQRMLLAGRSEVPKSLLANGMRETEQSEIELHGISSRRFHSVLEFLSRGTLSDYRSQRWMVFCELVLASRFFILPTLETIIRTFMRQQIRNAAGDLETAAAMLIEAVEYGLCEEKDDFIMLSSNTHTKFDSVFTQIQIYADFVELGFFYYSSKVGRERDYYEIGNCSEVLLVRMTEWRSDLTIRTVFFPLVTSIMEFNGKLFFCYPAVSFGNPLADECARVFHIRHKLSYFTLYRDILYIR